MRILLVILSLSICIFQGCLIEDNYGERGSLDDLGELLADEQVYRFIWSPPTNEIVYISQEDLENNTIRAVNISTKEKRTISSYNAAIDEIAWKNNDYKELLVSFRLDGNVANTLEIIDLSTDTKQNVRNSISGRSFNFWPDILSNEKFLAIRVYDASAGLVNLHIRNWSNDQSVELSDLHAVASSPDFEQVILVDLNVWPHQFFLYAIETADLFPLSGFNNFPANYLEWTNEGILAYIIQPNTYVVRNLGTFNTIQYDLTSQYELFIKGSVSGKSFLYLYQQCRNGGPVYDCSIGVLSEIYVRRFDEQIQERVMISDGQQFSELSFSPDEKAIAAIVGSKLYYKVFTD